MDFSFDIFMQFIPADPSQNGFFFFFAGILPVRICSSKGLYHQHVDAENTACSTLTPLVIHKWMVKECSCTEAAFLMKGLMLLLLTAGSWRILETVIAVGFLKHVAFSSCLDILV